MWDLSDRSIYFKFLEVTIPYSFTWGSDDQEKREKIRRAVVDSFPSLIPDTRWWAFRLYAKKSGVHSFDVDNIPKLIVDSFSGSQLERDDSDYKRIKLYEDDNVANVGMVQVSGEETDGEDSTTIEIFGRRL